MTVRQALSSSLGLLTIRDRRILILVTLAQMSTALLDLLGVLLIGVVTALSVSVMGQGSPPAFVQTAMDRLGIAAGDTITLAAFLAVVAGVVLVGKSIINLLLNRRVLIFLANRQALVSGRLASGLLASSLIQIQRRSSQESAFALTQGVSAATLTILGQGVVAVTEITLLLVLAIGLFAISPVVMGFTIVFFSLIAWVLQRVLSGWAGRLGVLGANTDVASYVSLQEALITYREVVVSQRRGLYVARFQTLRLQAARVQSDSAFIASIPKYVFEIALVIGAALLAASQLFTKDLPSAVAIIAVFLAAGSRVVPSMLRLQTATITVRSAVGASALAFDLADEFPPVETNSVSAAKLGSIDPLAIRRHIQSGYPDFEPRISLVGVEVSYPGTVLAALFDISLELPNGSSMALVGPTGAGKSTLADVILGVIPPDRGQVHIGGLPPSEAAARWPGALAYVPQEIAMTNGTVRENVALGLPTDAIDDDWVWDALDRAHLADFLRGSREGLDTMIGEHGVKLSGGQRQRLGVARALYTQPKFLVLDEATSALDAETEQAIAHTLTSLEGMVTTVTIAHRLATIRHCDLVVYLDNGKILASGTFDEVRNRAESFDQQARLLGL